MASNNRSSNGKGAERSRAPRSKPAQSRRAPQAVEQRSRRYMVAALPQSYLAAQGVAAQALDMAGLEKLLGSDPQVRVVRKLPASTPAAPAAAGGVPFPDIVIAEMTYEHADALRRQLPQLHLERDRLLTYAQAAPDDRLRPPGTVVPVGEGCTFTFLVHDAKGDPMPGAGVFVAGSAWPARAVTGADGRATVSVADEVPESIQAVCVEPPGEHWSLRLNRPALSTTHDNLITLRSLSETFPGFPEQQAFGWGQQAMHLHRLPPTFRGAGTRIAIIDSGADRDHPDLRDQVTAGADLVDRKAGGWAVDTVGHGSHSAGIVTGADDGRGTVGFAVESAVHMCKIFPGGRFSDLIEALDYCIDNEIDLVSLGVSSTRPSHLVAAKIEQARNAGVGCIAAAGNNGGPVTFPGNLATVLTVAAIGKTGTFPADSAHTAEIGERQTREGYFSARSSCHGPEVDVCAPGVAILSSVPPSSYAVVDGTSVAAPHVAGLAALVLAHHGDFRDGFKERNSARVDHLFQLIKSSCTPLDLGDPHRSGAGLPDALRALGPAVTGIPSLPSEVIAGLDQLTTEMIHAGLLQPAPTPTPETLAHAGAVRQPGLTWLAEEMRTAGLLSEQQPPDLLE